MLCEEMAEQGICLMTLRRSNRHINWSNAIRQKFYGLCTGFVNKVLVHNIYFALNRLLYKSCDISKIKYLIF